jgi:hypothetical protein
MSMSTRVQAFRDMDGDFKRMMEVKLFCDEHKVSYPAEVVKFFKGMAGESESCLRDEMLEIDIRACVRERSEDTSLYYEIDVSSIPPDVKTLRFSNSW